MELTNEFKVPVAREKAWEVLTNLELIAPCLPGAELEEVAGDEHRGRVKVKLGPITASYKGTARFTELDEKAGRAVLRAEGREQRGQGNASATITALLEGSGETTKVTVETDLSVTGKVAQFGRGVLADVSAKLLDEFAANLEKKVLSQPSGSGGVVRAAEEEKEAPKRASKKETSGSGSSAKSNGSAKAGEESSPGETAKTPVIGAEDSASEETVRQIAHEPAEPVDLMKTAGPSLARRIVPFASVAGGLFLLRIVIYALKRRKR